ncbi:MAG: DinB family protein [Actinomycetes bacterium]
MIPHGLPVDRASIHEELERSRTDLDLLVSSARPAQLRRRTDGTRWTNQQMLWHMAFGYLIVRRLLRLVRLFGRLPDPFSRAFAAVLNTATRPFHVVNYLGSVGGATVFHGSRLTRQMDRTIDRLHRSLDAESETALRRRMHFPVGWDPFFRETMSLEDVYRYGTLHYEFHRAQLTLAPPGDPGPSGRPARLERCRCSSESRAVCCSSRP